VGVINSMDDAMVRLAKHTSRASLATLLYCRLSRWGELNLRQSGQLQLLQDRATVVVGIAASR
jgi:hypothetical protein